MNSAPSPTWRPFSISWQSQSNCASSKTPTTFSKAGWTSSTRPSTSSSLRHRVRDFYLSGDDLLFDPPDFFENRWRDQLLVVLIEGKADPLVLQAVQVDAAGEFTRHQILYGVV